MGFVDHLKNQKQDDLLLEVAFGRHIIAGDLAKSIVNGSSPNHIVTVQQLLGDAFGLGWAGPVGVWFRGVNRPATKYRFYPGIQTPNPTLVTYTANASTDTFTAAGHPFQNDDLVIFAAGDVPAGIEVGRLYYIINRTASTFQTSQTQGGTAIDITTSGSGTLQCYKNDPVQGIDPIFYFDTPHSNTAWIRVECPSGSEVGIPDADTKNNPPAGVTGIFDCQKGNIYDASGNVTASGTLLTNPADVLAFGCMEIRKYPATRIDWATLNTLRQYCDQMVTPDYTTLPQGVGLTGSYYNGTNFNTFVSKRVDKVLQFDQSSGAPALGLTATSFSVRWEGKIKVPLSGSWTFYLTADNGRRLYVQSLTTPIIDAFATDGSTPAGTSTATITLNTGQFYDIKVEWNNGGSVAELKLEWQHASRPREVVPQEFLYPKNEQIKRFECHARFTQRTTFREFLSSVLFTCNGVMQDESGRLKFFSLDQSTYSFTFDETNIVKNTFRFYPRFSQQDLLNLPNRFVADGRDLDSQYLEPFDPPLYYDIAELQDVAGRVIEETVAVGNTRRWQGLQNLQHYAKRRLANMICEFEGLPQTLQVLPGDIVRVTHTLPGWTNKLFLVLEATDKSTDSAADERIFKLVEWS